MISLNKTSQMWVFFSLPKVTHATSTSCAQVNPLDSKSKEINDRGQYKDCPPDSISRGSTVEQSLMAMDTLQEVKNLTASAR
jgi:hypothetical protein